MKVSFSHSDADSAATITNAVTRAYTREVVDVERRQRMDRLNSLEKVFNDVEQRIRTKQTDLKRLADSLGMGDDNRALSAKQQIILQHWANLETEHTKVQAELLRTRLTLAELGEGNEGTANLKHKLAILTAQETRSAKPWKSPPTTPAPIGRSSIDMDMMSPGTKAIGELDAEEEPKSTSCGLNYARHPASSELQAADVPKDADTLARTRNTVIAALTGFLTPFLAFALVGLGALLRRRSASRRSPSRTRQRRILGTTIETRSWTPSSAWPTCKPKVSCRTTISKSRKPSYSHDYSRRDK